MPEIHKTPSPHEETQGAFFKTLKSKFSFGDKRLPSVQLSIFLVLFAVLGVVLLRLSSASTAVILAKEGETMTFNSAAAKIVVDSGASSSAYLSMNSTTTVTSTVRLPSASTGIQVVAKGTSCKGAAAMTVAVDGVNIISNKSVTTAWATYSTSLAKSTGSHTLSVTFPNDKYVKNNCDRNLHLDKIEFIGEVAIPSVAISGITTGQTVSGTIAGIQASSTNLTPAKVDFLLDGNLARTEQGAPYCLAGDNGSICNGWDSKAVADGSHSLVVKAYNSSGTLVATSPTVTFTVLNTATTPTTTTGGGATTPTTTSTSKLKWAPPTLTAPTTLTAPVSDATWAPALVGTKDYIIKLPASKRGPITLNGGHNIVIIGGYLHLNAASGAKRSIYLLNNTGTVHIEGVQIESDEGVQGDAVAIASPAATVQLENIRAMGIRGDKNGEHGDLVQPWGGVTNLNIDRLTGSSNYQGLFLRPDQGPLGTLSIHHVDMAYDQVATTGGGYLVWLTTDGGGTYGETAKSVVLDELYITQLKSGSSFGTSIWPQQGAAKGPTIVNNVATWPSLTAVTGSVKYATPSGGSFVPAGIAGTAYVSPGYQ